MDLPSQFKKLQSRVLALPPAMTQIAITALAALLSIWVFSRVLNVSYRKCFSMDELGFLHAGWMMARGYTVFTDFILLFIGVGQVSSLPCLLTADNIDAILAMRLFHVIFILIMGLAAWRITWTAGPLAAPLSLLFAFSIVPLAQYLVEVRPDSIAAPLFLASIAALYEDRLSPFRRAFACGALYAAAAWVTPKAFVCGWIYFGVIAFDAAVKRRKLSTYLVHPLGLAAGGLTMAAAILTYMWFEGTLNGLWQVTIPNALDHERIFTRTAWQWRLAKFFDGRMWIVLFAAVAAVDVVRRAVPRWRELDSPDVVLVGAISTTFLSFVIQRGGLSYSWLPLALVICVLAAKGVFIVARFVSLNQHVPPDARRPLAMAVIGVVLVIGVVTCLRATRRLERRSNDYQLAVISKLCELTWVSDRVYDNSASYVVRPNATRFYYTDRVLRKVRRKEMRFGVAEEIIDSRTKAWVYDRRFGNLPWELTSFLTLNFSPYSNDIWLWGRKYEPAIFYTMGSEFIAIEDGWYFLSPPSAVTQSHVTIDGKRVTTEKFFLRRGARKVMFRREDDPFYILWLPRNGKTYVPDEKPRPRFYRYTVPL